ncbi:bifunctional phosphoribosylaminoimidazolecarboxamide formyltransferase/IMP cyclohydrolase [Candidatus Blochmannia ocreatus (nom. nud.)]|uniref:Bifunctional purine biosynthesis protein PurH n=1 Tax=Candidatus Blochmannia ocreatus (nom. nud.) TaxID=251538 RepID=A0ABY4SVR3_9ENTR|nr:bifunctional phosphoribosylaminoimidazolecarboxamide formyltransferase/IMP cyclohydrolase [Candidatus Blochmannia ocreatus]URJ25030.1 bifunctional phosphoribosylaminoimidazolecarboxamide formyltransferase/IMP cyclohydrolase [Candidatus Blochmannia ocreatus]
MMKSLLFIRRALISVFEKSNVLKFSHSLNQKGVQLLATGGTAQVLLNFGLPVCKLTEYTKAPEIMNGRIKTLHYKIFAGILSRPALDSSIMHENNIQPIDMVVVNFYTFSSLFFKKNKCSAEQILDCIDIGGPSMVRAAAKNYKNVVVIVDNNDYSRVIEELDDNRGSISLQTRFYLATKAFKYVAAYDSAIADYFDAQIKSDVYIPVVNGKNFEKQSCDAFPKDLNIMNIKFKKKQNMRYGENPHQYSALYVVDLEQRTGSVTTTRQLQGKPLSYNNIIDVDTALECVKLFDQPTCVIIKHANPCGVATSDTTCDAYMKAYQSDPVSAFGGVIAFNRDLDGTTAQMILENQFVEVIVAPNIHVNCIEILSKKQLIRVLECGMLGFSEKFVDFKRVNGGLLVQNYNNSILNIKNLEVVTLRQPTSAEIKDALFCWKVVKFVKSNAVVCGKNCQTIGIGAGQMSRVSAVKIVNDCVNNNGVLLNEHKELVMASDAFFPFSDVIHIAFQMGVSCIIQPGGSIRDKEIIKIADKYNISMIFTHMRHFRH